VEESGDSIHEFQDPALVRAGTVGFTGFEQTSEASKGDATRSFHGGIMIAGGNGDPPRSLMVSPRDSVAHDVPEWSNRLNTD